MIDDRYTITSDAGDEVELLLTRFERDRGQGPVVLADYTPSREDNSYPSVVTELSRIDLEHGFNEGIEPDARRYVDLFPQVFENLHLLTQLAFEEYRLKRRGGNDVTGCEIGAKYNVEGSRWPTMKLGSSDASVRRSVSRRFSKSDLAPRAVHYPRVGDTFAGYPLVTRIGEGAFSRVFLARQPDLAGRLVVLKVTPLSTDESDRLASLQHTSIIPVYSVHREGDLSCICMPFLGATTLADLSACGERWASLDGPAEELVSTILGRRQSTIRALAKEIEKRPAEADSDSPQPRCWESSTRNITATSANDLTQYAGLGYVDALLELVCGAVEGLAHAHRRGIVHRDLKPANILVADDGTPILLDFNLAVSNQEPETRVVGGTLPYMSPQQLEALQSGTSADTRDDVFSIGVILYELLSGRLPFECPKSGDPFDLESVIALRIRKPNPIRDLNSGVTPGLESIIDRCLAPDRDQRYVDATQLLEDLKRFRDHQPLRYAPERSIVERAGKWSARHPRWSSATTVATFAAVVLAFCSLLIWQRGERIARLNVESRYQQFHTDLPQAIVALTTPGSEVELLEIGLEASSRLMNHWQVGSDRWQQLANVGRLDRDSQTMLRQRLGQLAYLMADAEYRMALVGKESNRLQRRKDGAHWNHLAAELYPSLQGLANFQEQRFSRDGIDRDSKEILSQQKNLSGDDGLDLRSMWAAESGDAVLWRQLTEKQLDAQPTNVTHWFNLGIANGMLGDLDAAAASFDVSYRLQPRSIAILLNRGICNLDRMRPRLAIRDFTACLRLDGRLMVPRFNRAIALYRVGDNDAALRDLDQLVQGGQATTRIVFMRARVHDALGESGAAAADRQAAMLITPRDANDWNARGVSQIATAPREALTDFHEALRIRPGDSRAIENIAHLFAELLDEPKKAIEQLSRLIALRPKLASAFASRGILRARLGEIESALADARAASELSPAGREQLQIAGIHALLLGDTDSDEFRSQAISWLARALRTDIGLASVARSDSDLANLRNDNDFRRLVSHAMTIDSQSKKHPLLAPPPNATP